MISKEEFKNLSENQKYLMIAKILKTLEDHEERIHFLEQQMTEVPRSSKGRKGIQW